ncbi:MAG: ACT domain-containing protein [Acidimicrobiales bacterium]
MLTRMRIWLPDAPGVLGAVAAEIGALGGNVIALEVLEREAGVAIDEFVVELPDRPDAVEAVCKGIRKIPGSGVEDVRELASAAPDREDTVLNAAAAILQAATPTAAMNALSGQLMLLFDLTWLAVADLGAEAFVEAHGEVPSIAWLAAFATGSQSGADPSNDTTSSGVFVEPFPDTSLTVCGGRPAPIRRRERHAIAMLVLVTARFVDALGWRERVH